MNSLHELPPTANHEYLYQPSPDDFMAAYAVALANNTYPGYPTNDQRLRLAVIPHDQRGLIAFDNTGPWVAGSILPTTTEKYTEVIHNIGYPKMCTLDADYRPLHPWWKHMVLNPDIGGVLGKGFFYRWGANYAADAAVTAQDAAGTTHLLLIQRSDTGEWALPGGFLNDVESTKAAAVRELHEESGLELERANATADKLYAGPVLDIRTTVHAWTETALWLFKTRFTELPTLAAADDAAQARWFALNEIPDNLYGSHAVLIDTVLKRLALETANYQAGEQHPL